MTITSKEVDLSVLEELDFPTPCAVPGHGTSSTCDNGPAVWIAEESHECKKKVVPICDRFKRSMEYTASDELVVATCGHLIPYSDYFKVVGKL